MAVNHQRLHCSILRRSLLQIRCRFSKRCLSMQILIAIVSGTRRIAASKWAKAEPLRSGVTPRALSKYGEEQHPKYHQHRKGPGQQDGDDDRVPKEGMDVALSDRLDEVQTRAVELVPQLAEGDWRPMLRIDPDQPIAHQYGGAGEKNDPADQAPDDHQRPLPATLAAKIIRPVAS